MNYKENKLDFISACGCKPLGKIGVLLFVVYKILYQLILFLIYDKMARALKIDKSG